MRGGVLGGVLHYFLLGREDDVDRCPKVVMARGAVGNFSVPFLRFVRWEGVRRAADSLEPFGWRFARGGGGVFAGFTYLRAFSFGGVRSGNVFCAFMSGALGA